MRATSLAGKPKRIAGRIVERIHRALTQFLTIPLLVVCGFVAVAFLAHMADVRAGGASHWGPAWSYFGRYVGDPSSATSLLSAIASGLITVTSITFSILLLAVQQGASALNSQIIDHYLRRKSNQVYFGCFVGVSLYTLVTLVLTTGSLRPVLGVMLATVFAGGALFALILLIYSTIEQIKPVTIINNMHDAALTSQHGQASWLAKTTGIMPATASTFPVLTNCNGYLARVRTDRLAAILREHPGMFIAVTASIGDYLVCGAELARVACAEEPDDKLVRALRRAIPVEEQRDIDCDPSFAVDQIGTIAWTAISTAKSNPAAALVACHALQDILSRWTEDAQSPAQAREGARIVYQDVVGDRLLECLESIFVVASESMQYQCITVILDAINDAYPQMPTGWKDRVEETLLTSLAALGDHLPTHSLGNSLVRMSATLDADGRHTTAGKVAAAWEDLRSTRGTINSRGNRGKQA